MLYHIVWLFDLGRFRSRDNHVLFQALIPPANGSKISYVLVLTLCFLSFFVDYCVNWIQRKTLCFLSFFVDYCVNWIQRKTIRPLLSSAQGQYIRVLSNL